MKPQVLIGLELTTAALLKHAVEAPAMTLAQDAANCTDPAKVFAEFDLIPHLEPHISRFEELAISAAIFGASRVCPPQDTMFTKGESLDLVRKAARQMVNIVGVNGTARIRDYGAQALMCSTPSEQASLVKSVCDCRNHMLFKADKAPKTITVAAGQKDIASALNAATMGNARLVSDAAANLTTTRLAAYGFLSQAKKNKQDTFQIDAVLDSKTCPVCMYMNGKTFSTKTALAQTEAALDADDPDDLEDIAPWPDQTKDGIADLISSDERDLTKSGYVCPPFHPGCRCLLSPAGDVPDTIEPLSEDDAKGMMESKGWLSRLGNLLGGKNGLKNQVTDYGE